MAISLPTWLLDRFQQKLSVQKLRTQLDVSKRKEENFVRLPSWGLRSPPVVLIAGSPLFTSFRKTLNWARVSKEQGFFFVLAGLPISWGTKKHKPVLVLISGSSLVTSFHKNVNLMSRGMKEQGKKKV
jgi:hypothetical protein